jgi:intracellular multiplication protein IcmO
LGKIVVAWLRGMMAQMLGSRLEGDYESIVANKPGMGAAPFHVVLDEVAYYATSGMDRMLAMGRGLNFMFWLGFQELSGIWARLGEKTASLLSNANLTVAMSLQDAGRTREWIEGTAGQTTVTQVSNFQGEELGEFATSRSADLRVTSRIDWRDLQGPIEGEAIILFGGRRIHAKLFHADVKVRGPMRLNPSLALPPPDTHAIRAKAAKIDALVGRIERGLASDGRRAERSPTLNAMIEAFARASVEGRGADECVDEALRAVGRRAPATPKEGESIEAIFTPMFESVAAEGGDAQPQRTADVIEPADLDVLRMLAAVEAAASVDVEGAYEDARRLVAAAKAAGYRARGAETGIEDAVGVQRDLAGLEKEIGVALAEYESELRFARSLSPSP